MAKEFPAPSVDELFKDFFNDSTDKKYDDVIDVDSAETQMMVREHIQKQQIDLTILSDDDDNNNDNNDDNNHIHESKQDITKMKQQNKIEIANKYRDLLKLNDNKLSKIVRNLTGMIGLLYAYIYIIFIYLYNADFRMNFNFYI